VSNDRSNDQLRRYDGETVLSQIIEGDFIVDLILLMGKSSPNGSRRFFTGMKRSFSFSSSLMETFCHLAGKRSKRNIFLLEERESQR
jgi:hypothetical protein